MRWLPWWLVAFGLCSMVVVFYSDAPAGVLLGLAACVTAASGLLTTVAAVKKSAAQASEQAVIKTEADCELRLSRVRAHNEKLLEEIYSLRGIE